MAFVQTLRLVLARPHRAGHPFIAAGGAVAAAGLFLGPLVLWAGLLFALFCLYFFRDPDRVPPERPDLVVAAADGRIVSVQHLVPDPAFGLGPEPRWRVGTFLSVLDVHVNRAPAAATVQAVAYRPGAYLNASLDKASEDNERNALTLRLPDGRMMAVVQVAGLVARRILCEVRAGDSLPLGGRFGMIRFGSRTDIWLPPGVRPLVRVGQTMVGGETVVADLAAPAGPGT